MPRQIARYGWRPDHPDHRDHYYSGPLRPMRGLPAVVDLRHLDSEVYDQGQLGSCTANAIAGAMDFELLKQRATQINPSRLFIYYNERVMEHTINSDAGAEIRDGIKSVVSLGAPPEALYPYDVQRFASPPSKSAYAEGLKHQVQSYQRLEQNLRLMKLCLASGFPFVFGFTVYDGFESAKVAKTGVLNMPGPKESVVGGHAVMCVGYDDNAKRVLVRNSWGTKWGKQGYFNMPYNYISNPDLASDFWTIRLVES